MSDKQEIKLNPCDCGEIPKLSEGIYNYTNIYCFKCGITFYFGNHKFKEEDVINWWNKKHPVDKPDGTEFINDLFEKGWRFSPIPETIPNCGICEWNLVMLGQNKSLNSYCTAQGRKVAAVCYNTPECKKLFTEEN